MKRELKFKDFDYPQELLAFVNSNDVEIAGITAQAMIDKVFGLFYYASPSPGGEG